MTKALISCSIVWLFSIAGGWAQQYPDSSSNGIDSLSVFVSQRRAAKISHAEPLYLDLVRDLGARKGEREWNVGTEFSKHSNVANWHPFVEYEFAPINRLGLEVEIPLQVTVPASESTIANAPQFRLHSVKTSIQWTYAVITRIQTSLAVGYTNELLVNSPVSSTEKASFLLERGHPFWVAAKRWGNHFHSLVYVSIAGEKRRGDRIHSAGYEANLALHYTIPNSKAFVGIELYQFRQGSIVEQVVRPQIRIALQSNLLVGVVGNIALRGGDPVSSFIRIVYEPKRR